MNTTYTCALCGTPQDGPAPFRHESTREPVCMTCGRHNETCDALYSVTHCFPNPRHNRTRHGLNYAESRAELCVYIGNGTSKMVCPINGTVAYRNHESDEIWDIATAEEI